MSVQTGMIDKINASLLSSSIVDGFVQLITEVQTLGKCQLLRVACALSTFFFLLLSMFCYDTGPISQ